MAKPDKNYYCPTCGKRFKTLNDLNMHIADKHLKNKK